MTRDETGRIARERDLLAEAAAALPDLARGVGLPAPSAETVGTLLGIVAAWPAGLGWPRVASDEDGCALLRWAGAGGRRAHVSVEGAILHVTLEPGSASRHLPVRPWRGDWGSALGEIGGTP